MLSLGQVGQQNGSDGSVGSDPKSCISIKNNYIFWFYLIKSFSRATKNLKRVEHPCGTDDDNEFIRIHCVVFYQNDNFFHK